MLSGTYITPPAVTMEKFCILRTQCISVSQMNLIITLSPQNSWPFQWTRIVLFVRYERNFLHIISTSSFNWADPWLWLSTSDFATRRLLFDPRPVTEISLVGKVVPGQVFLGVLQFSIVSIIPPMLPYSSSSTCCCYQKDKRAKLGNLQKKAILFQKSESSGCKRSSASFSSQSSKD
jgi:hypothetical protein